MSLQDSYTWLEVTKLQEENAALKATVVRLQALIACILKQAAEDEYKNVAIIASFGPFNANEWLEAQRQAARAEERERCARVVEQALPIFIKHRKNLAAAIRTPESEGGR